MTQGTDSLLLTVLIVNWNVRELLRACLESVYRETRLGPDRFEVIVVDNASCDGSAAMVEREFPRVRLIASQENLGFGGGNNRALPEARGSLLLLLNPDTVILDHALDRMVSEIEQDPSIWILGCRLVNPDGSLQRWTGGSFPTIWTATCHYLFLNYLLPEAIRPPSLYLDRDAPDPVDVDWVSGAVLLVRKERLAGKLFDARFFMYGEDMELCHRLKSAGGRVVYTPRASVVHVQGASMKQQSGAVLRSSLEGLRSFYRMSGGGWGLWLIDLVTVVGFGLRSIIYGVVACWRPGCGHDEKAASSRHYTKLALGILLRRK